LTMKRKKTMAQAGGMLSQDSARHGGLQRIAKPVPFPPAPPCTMAPCQVVAATLQGGALVSGFGSPDPVGRLTRRLGNATGWVARTLSPLATIWRRVSAWLADDAWFDRGRAGAALSTPCSELGARDPARRVELQRMVFSHEVLVAVNTPSEFH